MSVVTFQHPSNVSDWNAVKNHLEYTGLVSKYFFIAKPYYLQPSSLEFLAALSVIHSSIWRVVNAAVKLNHQAGFGTVKVNDVPTKGFLTQESQTLESRAAQCLLQNSLGRRWVFAVLTLQLEQVKGFFHGVRLNGRLDDYSGLVGGRSHPAAARRPSLVSRKRAKSCATRLPSFAGERRVGDESGVPINAPFQSVRP